MLREGLPVLLTVEEAGELLRIGRTKAYAMAREWRETEGRSGLPVVDLGHVLRVPRQALEEMIGAELTDVRQPHPAEETEPNRGAGRTAAARRTSQPAQQSTCPALPTTGRTQRRQKRIANQLDLFDAETPVQLRTEIP